MMRRWWLFAGMTVAVSSCTAQRHLVLPEERVLGSGPTRDSKVSWSLTSLSTSIDVGTTAGSTTGLDVEPLRRQLEARVRDTLSRQVDLGAVDRCSAYALEVELEAHEAYGNGKGLVPGVVFETGTLSAGAIAGALIGSFVLPGLGTGIGLAAGTIASTPPALLGALAFKTGGVKGEYRADLTLRRRTDRVPVAHTRVRAPWNADFSAYTADAVVAQSSGAAVLEFEKALLAGLRDMVVDVDAAASTEQPPSCPSSP